MSDYTTTPNLHLYKPNPGADVDTWGDHLNANADLLDAALSPTGTFLPLTGGIVTGATQIKTLTLGGGTAFTWSGSVQIIPELLPLYVTSKATGTSTSTFVGLNNITVTQDTVDASPAVVSALSINQHYGGGNTAGSRSPLYVSLFQDAPYGPTVTGTFGQATVGATITNHAYFRNTIPGGLVEGINVIAALHPGATGYNAVYGIEVDMNV